LIQDADKFAGWVAKEFGGRAFVAGEKTKQRRREYVALLAFIRGQNVMFERGRQARDKANEELKKKGAREFTPKMIKEATDRNIAKIRRAQAERKANKAVLSKTPDKTAIQAADRGFARQATDQDISRIVTDPLSGETDYTPIEYNGEWI